MTSKRYFEHTPVIDRPLKRQLCCHTRLRRRAGVLLAVLGVSLIVVMIGLSAMTALRIQRKESQAQRDAAQASHYARSAIDIGLFRIASDPAWRNNFSAWTTEFALGEDTMSFELTDEADGSISDDPYDAVLLTGKGEVGHATRLYSVSLKPEGDSSENLLDNGDMELGTWNWSSQGYAALESVTDEVHGDDKSILVQKRFNASGALNQSIWGGVEKGTTYYSEVWVFLDDDPENVKVAITINYVLGSEEHAQLFPVGDSAWTRLSMVKTVTWSGLPLSIQWSVRTTSTNQDFYVDDALLVEGTGPDTDPAKVYVVPGSWKRSVLP